MKTIKYAVIILAVALSLVGGAFAYWTDQVEVVGNIRVADWGVIISDFDSEGTELEEITVAYDDPATKKKINVDIDNLYPKPDAAGDPAAGQGDADYVWLSIDIKNEGSIPAKISAVNATVGDDSWVEQDLMFLYSVDNTLGTGNFSGFINCLEENLVEEHLAPEGTEGDTIEIAAFIWLSDSADVDLNGLEGSFTIEIDFAQFNAPANTE